MIVGKLNTLKVKRLKNGGAFLTDGSDEVYLPKIETPKGCKVGDTLEVFVFNSDKETLKATLQKPIAQVDEFAALEVKKVMDFGAFLDWGLEKDLFLPRRNFKVDLHEGQKIIVFIHHDETTKGVIATATIERDIHRVDDDLHEGMEVDLLIYEFSALGYKVIINNRYQGLLYQNEVFEKIPFGEKKKGYIKRIREDGKIDVSLRRRGFIANIDKGSEKVLNALKEHDGFLPLHDKSNPVIINSMLGMSKKQFKRTIGHLYKEGKITIEDNGIKLKK